MMHHNHFAHSEEPSKNPESSNPFSDSLDAYTVRDLRNPEKKRSPSQISSLLVRSASIAVCIGILGYSGYKIVDKVLENARAAEAYDELRVDESNMVSLIRSKNLPEPNAMPTVLQMLDAEGNYEDYVPGFDISPDKEQYYDRYYNKFLQVANTYDHVYAWIRMTDTNVNYPVMKGNDNSYYLEHNFKGERFSSGSIFADCGVSDNYYSNYNMVLYGHNMRDGSMFHSVKTWCNSAKIKTLVQTSQIEIYTYEGIYIYDILSFYIDNSNKFATVSFRSPSAYLDFLNSISKKSNIRTNREYDADSRICTLITCTNGTDGDSRYVVHGILNQFLPRT